jgi:hypothetical protein
MLAPVLSSALPFSDAMSLIVLILYLVPPISLFL